RGEGSGRRERDGGGLGSGTFEAQWPGFEARCLRFVGWLTPARRKTRFQVLVRLSWAGLLTRRASKKGFRSASYITSPFPKLAWRDPLFLFRAQTLRRKELRPRPGSSGCGVRRGCRRARHHRTVRTAMGRDPPSVSPALLNAQFFSADRQPCRVY